MDGLALEDLILESNFRDIHEWESFLAAHPYLTDDRKTDVIRVASRDGIIEPLTGRKFSESEIEWDVRSYRETGIAGGLNSRHRATLHAIERCVSDISKYETKIYAAEALTEFALLLRSRYPKFIGSEYAINEHVARWLDPIRSEDLTQLTFSDATFDIVTTNEVLEHVPSLDGALREICRVLKPGGWHIGTVPFLFEQQDSIVKAKLVCGSIEHLAAEPEYHGNPLSADGSLVFELPGWDILTRSKSAGFRDAFCKFIMSAKHGIASNKCGGIFVLCLQK